MLSPDHRAGGELKSRNPVVSRPRYGVFLGAVFLALGLYVWFAYLPGCGAAAASRAASVTGMML
jgi:hypothetical protein